MSGTILLREYSRQVEATDKLPRHDLKPALFGLFGEVGSIMTAAKKHYREMEAYPEYGRALEEEFGDAFWYLAALCRRLRISLDATFRGFLSGTDLALAATDLNVGPVAAVQLSRVSAELESALLHLGQATAALLSAPLTRSSALPRVRRLAERYVEAAQAAGLTLADVLAANINKVRGRFLQPDESQLPKFDRDFPEDEQIPNHFEIHLVQRSGGKCQMRWNGVFLGDPLTDNIADRDGYRFHDVFHFSHAAVLHWSPVFRSLIKHKRKSSEEIDETQDGGRAIVVEEGLTAWIFSRAKDMGFFSDQRTLSFDLLKTIRTFVTGYEVQECPLQLWEDAILQGYAVFRRVSEAGKGIIVGDRNSRRVTYRPLR